MKKPSKLATFEFNKQGGCTVYLIHAGAKIKYRECTTLEEVTTALNGITFSLVGMSAKDYAEKYYSEVVA